MAILLEIDNISRIYGEKKLFVNISFQINKGQKVALVAKNGSGKTTLLNIIAGKDSPDEGNIHIARDVNIGYLSQEPDLSEDNSIFDEIYKSSNEVQIAIKNYEKALHGNHKRELQLASEKMDALNAWEYENQIKKILSAMKISDINQSIHTLSGGQKKRVALAKTIINSPDMLILDEPTNHLDLDMIEWLEEYLSKTNLTLFMVTHDRYFLDRACDQILEMENGNLYEYSGNYSHYIKKKAERVEIEQRDIQKAQNLLRKEQDWMNRMPKARGTKAKYRVDNFYELQSKAQNNTQKDEINIRSDVSRMGKKIIDLNSVYFSWGDLNILNDFTYAFKRYEKAGIIGKNGSGKSTFLDIITNKIKPDSGVLETGETINFGYYEQDGIEFNEDTKVIDAVTEVAETVKLGNGDNISAASFLNYFLFPYPMHHHYIRQLSGGEKRRLYLVTILMQNPNFLILDEPTNDLDIFTLNVLEEYLTSFNGCVLIVSHDRYFMDKIVDHLFVFEGDGLVKDFPGNYSIYKDYCSQLSKEKQSPNKTAKPKEKPKNTPEKKLSYKEKRELEKLEEDIAKLETEKTELDAKMNSGELSTEELTEKSTRYGYVLEIIEEKTMRWLELSEKES